MAKTRLETGSVLDGFTVGELIHRGGMASLWEVTRAGDQTPMLMKIPVLHEGEDPAAIVSFEMEQMIMPRLKGGHVPRHIANGDFAVQPFIVMERLSGETLLPKLKELPLSAEAVADYGARIADALQSLHDQGVVHLDLKPSNIMFRPTGEAVMIDFGLAHDLLNPEQVALTARAGKLEQDGFFAVLKRKGEPHLTLIDKPMDVEAEASDAPIVAVAINLDDMTPDLADKLRRTALRRARHKVSIPKWHCRWAMRRPETSPSSSCSMSCRLSAPSRKACTR